MPIPEQSPDALDAEAHELLARGHTMLAQAARLRAAQARKPETPPTPRTSTLVDTRDCAHGLGVSTATINRLVNAGRIPFLIVGESRRFEMSAVLAALEQHGATENLVARATNKNREVIPGVRLLSRRKGAAGSINR
jgi:excisionase family DNA binding protein